MVDITRPVYGEAWASSGEKLSPTEIKVQSGWVQEMMPYQWENFLQNRQDTTLLYLLQKGVPEWSADQEYIGNKSIVTYNGYTYQAKSTNTGNLPTDSTYWKRTSPNVTDAGVVTLGSGGTGATNAMDARTNLELGTAATVSADAIVFKSVTGNAPAADKWTSPISLSLSGGATGSTSLDGSGNATIAVSGLNASSISSGTVPSTALSNATLKTSPTGSTVLAAGFTSERDLSPAEGYTRWNKTTKVVEVFNGTSWVVNTSQSETYLLNRANHTGTQATSTISGLDSALSAKAPLASPSFTGIPKAPTAEAGTNTTQVATTAFVQSAVSSSEVTFASAAENAAGTVQNKAVDPLGIRAAFNATGSAPVFACRAWVNFNGTGTVAIRAGGNVSSITDNGVGDYTINFTTAMPDANYAVEATVQPGDTYTDTNANGFSMQISKTTAPAPGLVRLIGKYGSLATLYDMATACVTIVR